MSKRVDITGQRFGRWFVVAYAGRSARRALLWHCRCDCGVERVIRGAHLKAGGTQSCGCLRREAASNTHRGHGQTGTRTHDIWSGMRNRCLNPRNHKYPKYGGRGITVCDRWNSFEAFLEDMGECPEGCSIERINNDGNYEPGNCRWATNSEQSRNKRNSRLLTHDGETRCLQDWAELLEIDPKTLRSRLDLYGWSVEKALTPNGNPVDLPQVIQELKQLI